MLLAGTPTFDAIGLLCQIPASDAATASKEGIAGT
jgi:hypothetical protein